MNTTGLKKPSLGGFLVLLKLVWVTPSQFSLSYSAFNYGNSKEEIKSNFASFQFLKLVLRIYERGSTLAT